MGLYTSDQISHVSLSPRGVHPIATPHLLSQNHQVWFSFQRSLSSGPKIAEFYKKYAPFAVVSQLTNTSSSGWDEFQRPLLATISLLESLGV